MGLHDSGAATSQTGQPYRPHQVRHTHTFTHTHTHTQTVTTSSNHSRLTVLSSPPGLRWSQEVCSSWIKSTSSSWGSTTWWWTCGEEKTWVRPVNPQRITWRLFIRCLKARPTSWEKKGEIKWNDIDSDWKLASSSK